MFNRLHNHMRMVSSCSVDKFKSQLDKFPVEHLVILIGVTMDGHTFPTCEQDNCLQHSGNAEWSAATEAIRKDVAEAIIKAKNPWDAKRLGLR